MVHVAVMESGYECHKLVALRPMKKEEPYLASIGAFVLQDLSGRGSDSKPYGLGPLSTTTPDFRARDV